MKRGYTIVKKPKTIYEWTIREVSTFIEFAKNVTKNVELCSPEFLTESNSSWRLNIMFYSSADPKKKDTILLYLTSLNKNCKIKSQFILYVSNDKKQRIKSESGSHTFCHGEAYGFDFFLKNPQFSKGENVFMPDNTLTVGVELMVDESTAASMKLPINDKKRRSMVDDYQVIFNSKAGSDMIINVGSTEFKAHRSILMVRSPVFFVMLSTNIKENKGNSITIRDLEPEIFHSVLEFIYTDQVTDLATHAEKLLEASERFQLQSLKEMCIQFLCQSINIENAAKMLALADRFNATEMMEYSSEFIVANSKHIVSTEGYKNMKESNPSLAAILFEKFVALH